MSASPPSHPSAQTPSPSGKPNKATWGALALSVAIHGGVLLIVGGYVIVEKIIPRTPFTEVQVGLDNGLEEAAMPQMEETSELPESPQTVNELATSPSSAPQGEAATPVDIMVSTATNTPFSLPPAVGAPSTSLPVMGTGTGAGQTGTGTGAGGTGAGPGGLRSLSTLFGSKGGGGEALTGNFYDLKQTAKGKDNDMGENAPGDYHAKEQLFIQAVAEFLKRWDETELQKFFRARETLSTTQIFIPTMNASEAPKAFNVERNVRPNRWLVHYKGEFTPPKSGTYRFAGCGDDILIARLDRKLVFNGSIMEIPGFMGSDRENLGRVLVGTHEWAVMAGEWFHLSAGKSYPLEILVGENPGGDLAMFLMIQEKGTKYDQRPDNKGPILPVFQTAPTKLPKFDEEKNGPTVLKEGFAGNPG